MTTRIYKPTTQRVSLPRELPRPGTADLVLCYRTSNGQRIEYKGLVPADVAAGFLNRAMNERIKS